MVDQCQIFISTIHANSISWFRIISSLDLSYLGGACQVAVDVKRQSISIRMYWKSLCWSMNMSINQLIRQVMYREKRIHIFTVWCECNCDLTKTALSVLIFILIALLSFVLCLAIAPIFSIPPFCAFDSIARLKCHVQFMWIVICDQ